MTIIDLGHNWKKVDSPGPGFLIVNGWTGDPNTTPDESINIVHEASGNSISQRAGQRLQPGPAGQFISVCPVTLPPEAPIGRYKIQISDSSGIVLEYPVWIE